MPKSTDDDLAEHLRQQDAEALIALLIELADEHAPVRQRLVRLKLAARPDKLAATFRKSLAAWRRPSRFLPRGEAGRFGRELETWLGQVERELLPKDPAAAQALAEAFIESDAVFFERADDSNGAIGDAVRAGCQLWLKAAAQCEAPKDDWPARLARLASGDEYGAREELWRSANLLLSVDQLSGLAMEQMHRLEQAVATAGGAAHLPYEVYALSASLSLLAQAMRDPDVHVRAVLTYSPQPTPLQIEKFAQAYLDVDRPADALRWLDEPWDRHEANRLSLRSDALARLGRASESAGMRGQLFRQNVSAENLVSWLEALPPVEQSRAVVEARVLAESHSDPATAARVLMEIHDDAAAQARLVADHEHIDGDDYVLLPPLARALEACERWSGATAVYRALLNALLERGYTRAFSHGGRYLVRLRAIAASHSLQPLQSHDDYEAELRRKHGRKSSFWASVEAAGRARDSGV